MGESHLRAKFKTSLEIEGLLGSVYKGEKSSLIVIIMIPYNRHQYSYLLSTLS